MEKSEKKVPLPQFSDQAVARLDGQEVPEVVEVGDPMDEAKGDSELEHDGSISPRWSRLANELGTGCRPYLGDEDAAAAAAAALLKRLGGAKADRNGGLPAVAPFAEQLPSPLFCRPLPLFCRRGRVRFDEALNTEHEVTPYAEVYGRHPRHFVFDRHSCMIAAAPGGFVSLHAGAITEEEPEEDDEADSTAAELGGAAAAAREEPEGPEVASPAKEEAWQAQTAKDDREQQDYQDEDEECLFALPASLEEALEVTMHAPAKTSSHVSCDSHEVVSAEENWEEYHCLAAWSANTYRAQSTKGDRLAAECAPRGTQPAFTDKTNLTSAFIFSPSLMTAW